MSYDAVHASALADVKASGSLVTFTKQQAAGVERKPKLETVSGYAMRVQGQPQMYQALGLKVADAVTLLFAASAYGDEVPLGATVTWGNVSYTVRDVAPVAPDGKPIISRVTVTK